MNVKHRPTVRSARPSRMKQAKALTAVARRCRQKKRLRLHREAVLPRQLGADKVGQRTNCGECGTVNIIIVNDQAKLLFKGGDEGDDSH